MRSLFLSASLLVALTVPLQGGNASARPGPRPAENSPSATSAQSLAATKPKPASGAHSFSNFEFCRHEAAEKAEMARAVRAQFLHAWNGYRKYAWGHDELRPLTRKPYDWYGVPLDMTPVDALDTMILMGLDRQAARTRRLVDTRLSFDRDIYVKTFEVTIRLLAGLESGYELTGDKRLLALAEDLGNRLMPVFHSPTGMPYRYVNLKTGAVRGTVSNPAEIGTLTLEFGTLSRLTGNPAYFTAAKRAVVALYSRRSSIGLVGSAINIETGKWTGDDSFIGGGIDSYYEYLLKGWLLFGDRDFQRMWKSSVASVNKYVARNEPTGFWYGQVNRNSGAPVGAEFGALAAFWPGELALSGDLPRARRLEDSCYKMWSLYGIEPEELNSANLQVIDPGYMLRPEIIESAFYLYRFTGDARYLRMGRAFYDGLVRYCRTADGFAALSDVRTKRKANAMPSFFLAETLKYLYLLYAPRQTLNLHRVVFNTEAHPLRKMP